MFRKNSYKEATKCIKRESEQGNLEIQDFQIITPNRFEFNQPLETRVSDPNFFKSQNHQIDSLKRMQTYSFSNKMAKNNKHCEVGETNKLSRIQNYNVWKIKMEAILRREKLLSLVKSKHAPVAYPMLIGGVTFQNQEKLDSEK